MVYVENNHPTIISKDMFYQVKAEKVCRVSNEYGAIRAEVKAGALELAKLAQSYGKSAGVGILNLRQRLDALTTKRLSLDCSTGQCGHFT